MKLANATVNDVQHEWQKLFVAALTERVGDKVKAEIYPASQLGAIPRMAEGVSLGTIESFITPTSFVTNIDPRFQISTCPACSSRRSTCMRHSRSRLSRPPGDHVPRSWAARDRRDL